MALLISGLTANGYTYNVPLYCRIISPASTKLNIDLVVSVYSSQQAREQAPHSPITTITFQLTAENKELFTCDAFKCEGNEPFTASYNYLKTLYPDAVFS